MFTLTTSQLQSPNRRCEKNKRTQKRAPSRGESKNEVIDNTLPAIWWSSELRSWIFRAACNWIDILLWKSFLGAAWTPVHEAKFRSMIALVVNWFGKTAINGEIVQETRDLLPAQETSKHTNADTMCRELGRRFWRACHANYLKKTVVQLALAPSIFLDWPGFAQTLQSDGKRGETEHLSTFQRITILMSVLSC